MTAKLGDHADLSKKPENAENFFFFFLLFVFLFLKCFNCIWSFLFSDLGPFSWSIDWLIDWSDHSELWSAVHSTTRLARLAWGLPLCWSQQEKEGGLWHCSCMPEHSPPQVWKQLCPGTHQPCLQKRESSAVFSVRSSPLNQNKHGRQTLEEDASVVVDALIPPFLWAMWKPTRCHLQLLMRRQQEGGATMPQFALIVQEGTWVQSNRTVWILVRQ